MNSNDLRQKPWGGSSHPKKMLSAPKGMIGPKERAAYYWLGRNWASGQGCIVDAGAFLGASTFCFAAGAADAGNWAYGQNKLVHAYDYFKVIDKYVGEAITRDFRPIGQGESYLDIFQDQTSAYEKMIQTYPGDFLEQSWTGDPIEVLFIDVAKSDALKAHAVDIFFRHLIPGRSVLVHQDYYHCWHPYIHIAMEYFVDEFELIDEHVPHQSRIWRLAKPIPEEKLQRIVSMDLEQDERIAILDHLIANSSDFARPMNELVRIWELCRQKKWEQASQDFSQFETRYNLSTSKALWARQSKQVLATISEHMQPAR